MPDESPAQTISNQARAYVEAGAPLGIVTDARSYPGKVLVAVANSEASCVLQIAASEYDGIWLFDKLAPPVEQPKPPPDIEQLKKEKHAAEQNRPIRRSARGRA